MNIVNVVQGSPEWLALRAKCFTASDASAMLGLSEHKARKVLLREKVTGLASEVDAATQKRFDAGHASEAAARPIVEARLGLELFPVTATLDLDGLQLSASFDGVSEDEKTVWENKLANNSNADLLAVIDDKHWPQLEQQMLVAGVNREYFTVSDGTEAGTKGEWYLSLAERRAKLIAGWKQFQADLAVYRPEPAEVVVVGHAPEMLPALRIEVTGMVTASNLTEFRSQALTIIGAIKTDLQTDDDFASAEKTVKWCGDLEERLEAAKQHALSQTASIDELFRAIDQIKVEARAKRLELDKLVKTRKEAIRSEIVCGAQNVLKAHIEALNQRLGKQYMPTQDMLRFAVAIKGMKTISSLRDAVATEIANAKIETSEVADKIELNLKTLRELARDHAFLFADTAQIVLKQNDDLTALVKTRIADHKAVEEKHLEEERDRIRREEQAKTEAIPQSGGTTQPGTTDRPPATDANAIEAYLASVDETPKTKAMIRKHLAAFLVFREQTKGE